MRKLLAALMIILLLPASLGGCYTAPDFPDPQPIQRIEVPIYVPVYESPIYYYDIYDNVYRIRPYWRIPAYRGAPNIRSFELEKMRENREEMIRRLKAKNMSDPEKREEVWKKRMRLREKPQPTRKDGTLTAPERALKRSLMLKSTPDPEEKQLKGKKRVEKEK